MTICSIGIFGEPLYKIYVTLAVILVICQLNAHSVSHQMSIQIFYHPARFHQPITYRHQILYRNLVFNRPFLSPSEMLNQYHPIYAISLTEDNVTTHNVPTPTDAASVIKTTLNLSAHETNNNNFSTKQSTLDYFFNPLPTRVVSPINIVRLRYYLKFYPDPAVANYLLDGFSNGFDIGFRGVYSPGQYRNLLSARSNPIPVTEAIRKELVRGHTSGPFPCQPFPQFHSSPLGAVPKKDGSHRIILDLSSPRGFSINEGISQSDHSVHYSSFDSAVSLAKFAGPGCFMAKIDIKHAFRLCPVQLEDFPLLGYTWDNKFFVDTRLPFGMRSSPFIFNTFADALAWIFINCFGVYLLIHYLDDYFMCNSSFNGCHDDMNKVQTACQELGVPLAPDKIMGPAKSLIYLGIEIDSVRQTIRLPEEKYNELLATLATWVSRKKCTERQLLSLIGSLSFACKVVKPGRIFLRRLIDLSCTVSKLNHHISLTTEARADILWWHSFLPNWNGVEFFQDIPISAETLLLFTDASNLGFGAIYGNHWLAYPWPNEFLTYHINFKEFFAISASIFTWGNEWDNKQIKFFTDNLVIVDVWKKGTCRDKNIMRLVRHLFFFLAKRNINVLFEHLPGRKNYLADALSRLQVHRYQQLVPDADLYVTPLPDQIWRF